MKYIAFLQDRGGNKEVSIEVSKDLAERLHLEEQARLYPHRAPEQYNEMAMGKGFVSVFVQVTGMPFARQDRREFAEDWLAGVS